MTSSAAKSNPHPSFAVTDYQALLLDLDGVLTPTAEVHMRAWARMFSEYLAEQGDPNPYTSQDYFDYIDGKPRYDGVRTFLQSRNIELPEGSVEDAPEVETICGLGNRKNFIVHELLNAEGVDPYPGSVAFLDSLPKDFPVAVVSSSKNAEDVLRAAGLLDRFEVIVDGKVAAQQGLPGKPAPDTFEYAARLLDVDPSEAVVVEDAISGVSAGHSGPFRCIIGVNRGVGQEALTAAGATIVVDDLDELVS